MALTIEPLPRDGLLRFREVDRSEEITTHYRRIGTELVAEPFAREPEDIHMVLRLPHEKSATLAS